MSTKKTAGRRQNEVWEYFIKTPLNSHGHYSAECNFCKQRWGRAYVQSLQAHLANNCPACPDMIQRFYLEVLSAENLAEDITSTSSRNSRMSFQSNNSNKKIKFDQKTIDDFCENKELSEGKIEAINIALVRAFVCCGIPFSVIDNPFFRELLYQLQANYGPPSRQTLAGQLLSKEISKVNLKIDQELSNAENLTLVLTPDHKQYLYCLWDYSETHHTGQFLAAEIKTVLTKIGVQKFGAVVTDKAANIKLAQELISKEYPKIINI
ncbi:17357_t:CDS:2 [Entrophospora sp. SA101]|nr:17357_t:CDS:2 [Entrophospora sp. SA101]